MVQNNSDSNHDDRKKKEASPLFGESTPSSSPWFDQLIQNLKSTPSSSSSSPWFDKLIQNLQLQYAAPQESLKFPGLFADQQKLESEIHELRTKQQKLVTEIEQLYRTEHASKRETTELKNKVEELSNTIEESNKKQGLRHLLDRVNEAAKNKLIESEEFRNRFETGKPCTAVVMAVDIRRSTELMLKAREPQFYADFITGLCADLTQIILGHYGVFDKFTGDGILSFFPDFYSGNDSPYLAVKAADECHKSFHAHYHDQRKYFKSILLDVGLGIGIDYGEAHLVKVQDGLTVIGTPVVYACRMSGAAGGQTLLNQPAYEITSQKFGEYVNFQETEIDIKHEGKTLAYLATLAKKRYEPKPPDWIGLPASTK